MKPGKHQRNSQRCQDLCLKVRDRDRAQPFVFRPYTMHELRNHQVSIGLNSSVQSKQLLCFVQGQGQKSEQKPTTKNFVGFHNHSPLLTMIQQFFCQMVSVEQILVVIKNNYFFNTQCYSHVVSNCTILCYCTMLNFF